MSNNSGTFNGSEMQALCDSYNSNDIAGNPRYFLEWKIFYHEIYLKLDEAEASIFKLRLFTLGSRRKTRILL